MPKFIDLTGRKFYHLTVIERAETKNAKTRWKCLCDCGKYTYTITNRLLHGKTRSCGCSSGERHPLKHNKTNTRLYKIWCNMKKRCFSPNCKCYYRYGGRGITVCEEWKNDFQSFYNWSINNGYADNLSIDRINNNKSYSPDNCRWITMKEQSRNKRNNVYIQYGEKKVSLPELCESLNIPYKTAISRYKYAQKAGRLISVEELSQPKHTGKPIDQYSVDGIFIRSFDSITIAAKETNLQRSKISECCNGHRKSYNGYVFKFTA